jgi:uncharacterized membrane protein (Fun14 family)
VAIVDGLLFGALAYLQYQQILNINWSKLQVTSQNAVSTLANATTQISSDISNVTNTNNHRSTTLTLSNLGIPLTGGMAI